METSASEIARQLGGAKRSGDNWSCKCPAHDDRQASLSIKDTDDGKLLVRCHAGCEQSDVINELKILGLWPGQSRTKPVPKSLPPPVVVDLPSTPATGTKIVATYDYVDEDGKPLYQAVRFEPKTFRQRQQNPDGTWKWSLAGARRVLYRLPQVIEAVATGQTVYICEGEKDVHTAESLGLVATCNAMGADNGNGNKWFAEFAQVLKGANVVVIPDQDDPGIRHAEWVISTLRGVAHSVKVCSPAAGKDLADWVQSGCTKSDIESRLVDAFEVDGQASAPRQGFQFLDVAELITDIKPIQWLVRDYFERDAISLIYGPPGCGKSFFAIDIAASIALGEDWFGHKVHSGPVFYIAGEGHNGLARRFKAWEVSRGVPIPRGRIFKSAGALSILDEDAVLDMVGVIEATIAVTGEIPATVVIDTLARNFGAGDENSTEDMSRFIMHVDRHLRQRWSCNVLIVHHSGHNMERARGSSALKAAVDSEIEVTKDEAGNVKIKATKMKDAELPQELLLQLKGVELPGVVDEDGNVVTSAVLQPAGNLAASPVAERTDGTKISAKEALEILDRGWLSIRALSESLECSKRQAEKVMTALKNYKFIDDKSLTDEGRAAISRLGHELKQKHVPIYKRADLD